MHEEAFAKSRSKDVCKRIRKWGRHSSASKLEPILFDRIRTTKLTPHLAQIESLNPHTDLPIICGGTHYYTQHFLFPPARLNVERSPVAEGSKSANTKWRPPCALAQVLETLDGRDLVVAQRIRTEPGVREYLETFWTPHPVIPDAWRAGPDGELLALHRLLAVVDAREAGRWHWRDGRKVRRGLERWWEGLHGVKSGQGEVQPGRSRCVFVPWHGSMLIALQVPDAHVLGVRRPREPGAAAGPPDRQDGRGAFHAT